MGVGDATTPVAYEDHSSNKLMSNMPVVTMIPSSNGLDDMMHARCYCDWALLLVTHLPVATCSLGEHIRTSS
jgi:hypothetical protein